MKIALITGGETGEREVSIRSAVNIKNSIHFAEVAIFTFPEDTQKFVSSFGEFDLVIPVIHGMGGEDGSLQSLLKRLQIPFLFSDVSTNAIAIDKQLTKDVAKSIGIVSPQIVSEFPLFAKPRNGGSSIATKLCSTQQEFDLLQAQLPGFEFIAEEPIKGREFTVGVISYQGKVTALPVIEIVPRGDFFDYESKYDAAKLATEICPAQIDSALAEELKRQALAIHSQINVRHLSRSDFIVTSDNKIYFLEINTIPGMTDTSLIPKMLATADLSLSDLLEEWCSVTKIR